METSAPPTLESSLSPGLYSDEEKAQILADIEAAAGANRLTEDSQAFQPRKRGVLFPILVNLAALALIVGAWFGAEAYFQTRQAGLKLRTDKLFSAESKLLAQVIEESKAQMAEAKAQIDKIEGDLQKASAEKNNLEKTFEDRVATQGKALRKELADVLEAERARLQASGLGEAEVTRRLQEFEKQKNAEFSARLEEYRRQAQQEIEQRTQALTALQAKLTSTVAEQDRIRKDLEKQTSEREGSLQSQLSVQAADLDTLKKEREELNLFFRQSDGSLAAIRTALEARDWTKARAAIAAWKGALARSASSEVLRSRASASSGLADSFDIALKSLEDSLPKAEAAAQVEVLQTQIRKEQSLAANQAAEAQKALTTMEALQAEVAQLTLRLETSGGQAADVQSEVQTLTLRVSELESLQADLERRIAELSPYQERITQLSNLFAASYPTAEQRFRTTFGSTPGRDAFPGFDASWAELSGQIAAANAAPLVRKQALNDVLSFTSYLRGRASSPDAVREANETLARKDADFRAVVEDVQELAAAGPQESRVSTALDQLYGTVTASSGTKVILEPLTKVRPKVGDVVEVRRRDGKRETLIGKGTVSKATESRVEIEWSGSQVALAGDAAFLLLP